MFFRICGIGSCTPSFLRWTLTFVIEDFTCITRLGRTRRGEADFRSKTQTAEWTKEAGSYTEPSFGIATLNTFSSLFNYIVSRFSIKKPIRFSWNDIMNYSSGTPYLCCFDKINVCELPPHCLPSIYKKKSGIKKNLLLRKIAAYLGLLAIRVDFFPWQAVLISTSHVARAHTFCPTCLSFFYVFLLNLYYSWQTGPQVVPKWTLF